MLMPSIRRAVLKCFSKKAKNGLRLRLLELSLYLLVKLHPSLLLMPISADIDGQADARLDALRRNSDYTEYIKQLVSAGYFKSEREGSALWNELERKAVDVFVKTRSSE